MAVQMYRLKCDYCQYNRWTDGTDVQDLVSVVTCVSCGGNKHYKCPSCGRLIKARKYNVPVETVQKPSGDTKLS